MNKLRLAALALVSAAAAFAQNPTCNTNTIPTCSSANGAGAVQIKPIAVPTSTTVVAGSDSYLQVITVSNPTGGAITFTLADRQASPLAVLGAVSVAANTTYIISWPDNRLYWCPNGFTVTSSGAGLTFSGAFKQ